MPTKDAAKKSAANQRAYEKRKLKKAMLESSGDMFAVAWAGITEWIFWLSGIEFKQREEINEARREKDGQKRAEELDAEVQAYLAQHPEMFDSPNHKWKMARKAYWEGAKLHPSVPPGELMQFWNAILKKYGLGANAGKYITGPNQSGGTSGWEIIYLGDDEGGNDLTNEEKLSYFGLIRIRPEMKRAGKQNLSAMEQTDTDSPLPFKIQQNKYDREKEAIAVGEGLDTREARVEQEEDASEVSEGRYLADYHKGMW